ncbi:unnamed protein product [Leuciscus chuanchicus]
MIVRLLYITNSPFPTTLSRLTRQPRQSPSRAANTGSAQVPASHCQGDVRYDSFSRNHQCTCVALTFLVNYSEGIKFKMPNLDRVLEEGDALYVGIKIQLIAERRFNCNHLTMEEVPLSVSSFNRIHDVRKSEVMIGYLRATGTPGTEEWGIPLTERLQCLSTDVSHALLLVAPDCIAVFREGSGRMKAEVVRRYSTDALFHKKMKEYTKKMCSTDALFQKKMKEYKKKRYNTDALFQKKMKEYKKKRYSTDALFQKKMKDYMKKRYSTDALFQRRMKEYMVRRYAGDPEFRAHHILRCTLLKTQKYVGDAAYLFIGCNAHSG